MGFQSLTWAYIGKTIMFASSLNMLGQFQLHLAGIIIWGCGFRFVEMGPLAPLVLDLGAQKGQNVLFP